MNASDTGLYEIWSLDVDGRPLFCEDRRLTIWDANERLRELLDSGQFGGRLQIIYPKDRSMG